MQNTPGQERKAPAEAAGPRIRSSGSGLQPPRGLCLLTKASAALVYKRGFEGAVPLSLGTEELHVARNPGTSGSKVGAFCGGPPAGVPERLTCGSAVEPPSRERVLGLRSSLGRKETRGRGGHFWRCGHLSQPKNPLALCTCFPHYFPDKDVGPGAGRNGACSWN